MSRFLQPFVLACCFACFAGSIFAAPQNADEKPAVDAQAQVDSTSTENTHPLANDPTGINWAFSLEEAIESARKTNRLVGLMPVSFRSKIGSDVLSPSMEALRAVTLVDRRVVNLINRRVVFYYFDMDKHGDFYDEKASNLAKDLHPEMKYFSTLPTPPMIFMTPERKMLGIIDKSVTADTFLEKMVELLEQNQEYLSLNSNERLSANPVDQALAYYELRQLDKAMEKLDKQPGSEAFYLRGLISREQEDWAEMKRSFKMITQQHRLQDITIEIGLRYWKIKNFEGLKAKFGSLQKDHPRYQEAMYYLGLAYLHTNDTDKAMEVWKAGVEADLKSAWAFRLDWSLGLAQLGPDSMITPYDRIPSILGRYYMTPDGNPDMKQIDQ